MQHPFNDTQWLGMALLVILTVGFLAWFFIQTSKTRQHNRAVARARKTRLAALQAADHQKEHRNA